MFSRLTKIELPNGWHWSHFMAVGEMSGICAQVIWSSARQPYITEHEQATLMYSAEHDVRQTATLFLPAATGGVGLRERCPPHPLRGTLVMHRG